MHALNTTISLLSIAITWNYLTPTNNRLRTSLNLRNHVDYNPPRQFTPPMANAPARTYALARHTIGNVGNIRLLRLDLLGIHCNSKEKRGAKDYEYHILCKKEEDRIPLNAEECDFLAMTDGEDEIQELDASRIFMAKIHEVVT
ncbi:hypothetical protein Tco_0940201 [Tanacetum coccineum]|uniref:Uncharacterized protein n=1 Tax=Tanacetum coccineum TaxID=301880 RepID=A0ABQ5DQ01_9ASTR